MPQPCILLKIQHIHYRFTWQKKGEAVKCKVPAQLCPSLILESAQGWTSLPCQTCSRGSPELWLHVTDHSSLPCKGTTARPCLSRNTSRKLQGNHIWKSSCQLETTFQPEMSISRTGRVWSSLCRSRGGKGSSRASLKPWLSAVKAAQVMDSKGKLCILNLCDLQLYK